MPGKNWNGGIFVPMMSEVRVTPETPLLMFTCTTALAITASEGLEITRAILLLLRTLQLTSSAFFEIHQSARSSAEATKTFLLRR